MDAVDRKHSFWGVLVSKAFKTKNLSIHNYYNVFLEAVDLLSGVLVVKVLA